MKIRGFDKLQRTIRDAQRAATELDGDLAEVRFDPSDLASIEAAISEAKLTVDNRLGAWYGNPIVDQMAEGTKADFEAQIWSKVEEYKLENPSLENSDPNSVIATLERVTNAVADMRRSDYQTFDRHVEKLARALDDPSIRPFVDALAIGVDFDKWLKDSNATERGMGSAQLKWPDSDEKQLGLTIELAKYFSRESQKVIDFAHTFFYNGKKITPMIQHMVSQVFVPFERDFSSYVRKRAGIETKLQTVESQEKYPRRIFIVHGHDDGVRDSVARFLESLEFEIIILHEQANKGRTIIEKFEQHADVGFAIILMTPDDLGRSLRDTELAQRARQNVILELGYFIGKLSRSRVVVLRKDDVETPSDVLGVIYTPFDAAGAWKLGLAKEIAAAGYAVDWNTVMSGKK